MDGIRERAVLVVVVVFVCIISLFHVGFAAPYPSYVYDFWHQSVPAPDAYLPVRAVSGRDLGIGDFSDAQDLAVGRDGTIYIADTGNNRLVLLDTSFSRVRVISEFDRDGVPDRLSAPSGIFVTGDGEVYIGRCRWVTTYLGSLQRAGRL
ncbi:MAG: hypothetical protein WBJ04_05390 [Bacillota bacterium]